LRLVRLIFEVEVLYSRTHSAFRLELEPVSGPGLAF